MSTILTKAHAIEVVKKMEDGEYDGDYESIPLKSFLEIEEGAANVFAEPFKKKKPSEYLEDIEINFDGLRSISEKDLEIFSKCKINGFSFNKLEGISEKGYGILSKFPVETLSLGGVKKISGGEAEKISKFRGDLFLGGLVEISENIASILAKKAGKGLLSLGNENTQITDAAMSLLAEFQGSCLCLDLKEITDPAAANLAHHKGYLQLISLQSLSDAAAQSLSQHQGDVTFFGLEKISRDAIRFLAKTKYVFEGFRGDAEKQYNRFREGDHDDVQEMKDDSSRWQGPLSLSIGFEDGSYVNANLAKGIEDYGVLEAILRCKKFLKKPKKEDGFVIGWEDLSDKSGGRLDQGDESSALILFADIEDFMRSSPSKKTVKRNKK